MLRVAARGKFDEALSGMRVSPDVGKQMMDAIQVCSRLAVPQSFQWVRAQY